MLVWLAARRAQPGKKLFLDYAILGDDIVIADEKVALAYRDIMSEAQAVISLEKTLVSHRGACEFAKRFLVHCGSVDLSPVSTACIRLCSSNSSPGIFKQLCSGGQMSLRTSVRLRGGGFRVYNKANFKTFSRRWRRHWLAMHCPSGIFPMPLVLWLGCPFGVLDCYQYWAVRDFILRRIKPKDLDERSFDQCRLFWEGNEEAFEWTIQSLVSAHCRFIAWYARVSSDFSVPLEEIIHPPLAARKIERASEDEQTVIRFGTIFAAWDFLRRWNRCKVLAPLNFWVTRV